MKRSLAGLALALSALGAGCSPSVSPAQTPGEWYASHVSSQPTTEFSNDSFAGTGKLPPEVLDLDHFVSKLEAQLGEKPILSGTHVEHRRVFTEATLNATAFEDYARMSRTIIDGVFSYAGIDNLKPDVRFVRLTSATVPQEANGLTFYVARSGEDRFEVVSDISYSRGKGSATLPYIQPLGGEITTHYTWIKTLDGMRQTSKKSGPVVVSLASGASVAFSSPVSEALHFALTPVREQYMQDELHRTNPSTRDEVLALMERAIHFEEGMVHSLVDTYLNKYAKALGISSKDLAKYQEHCGEERYSLVGAFGTSIKELGPKIVMQKYLRDTTSVLSGKK